MNYVKPIDQKNESGEGLVDWDYHELELLFLFGSKQTISYHF
jgi:hypothetical protein